MTKKQQSILDRIEELIMQLAFSDKTNKAKGEIEDMKRSVRETTQALLK